MFFIEKKENKVEVIKPAETIEQEIEKEIGQEPIEIRHQVVEAKSEIVKSKIDSHIDFFSSREDRFLGFIIVKEENKEEKKCIFSIDKRDMISNVISNCVKIMEKMEGNKKIKDFTFAENEKYIITFSNDETKIESNPSILKEMDNISNIIENSKKYSSDFNELQLII